MMSRTIDRCNSVFHTPGWSHFCFETWVTKLSRWSTPISFTAVRVLSRSLEYPGTSYAVLELYRVFDLPLPMDATHKTPYFPVRICKFHIQWWCQKCYNFFSIRKIRDENIPNKYWQLILNRTKKIYHFLIINTGCTRMNYFNEIGQI